MKISGAHLQKILFLVVFWLFANLFFVYFEGTVIGFESTVYWSTGSPYNFWLAIFTSGSVTLIAATVIATFEVLYFDRLLRKKPFGRSLVMKTVFYVTNIFLFVSLGVLFNVVLRSNKSLFDPDTLGAYHNFLRSPLLILLMIYWSLAVISALFLLQINNKFGKGILWNLLLGRYHRPRSEVRIFMFLDLTSATSIAEKIGAEKYSALLRDFFFDLDEAVNKTKGAIFQFVGDEVVIIWDVKNGIKNHNCIELFFQVENKVRACKDRYLEKYGLFPQFKAGLHYGEVIITEVGGSKQEIAYHGDPINTAARIRSICNEVRTRLLTSAELLEIMPDIHNRFTVESKGEFQIPGKKNVIGLFGVEAR